jgi:hypothetical protein
MLELQTKNCLQHSAVNTTDTLMQYFVESVDSPNLVSMYSNLEYNPFFNKHYQMSITGLCIAVGYDVEQMKTEVESLSELHINCYTDLLATNGVAFKYPIP